MNSTTELESFLSMLKRAGVMYSVRRGLIHGTTVRLETDDGVGVDFIFDANGFLFRASSST